MTLKNGFGKCSLFFSKPMDDKIKTTTLRFPAKKTLIYGEGNVRLANCVTV